MVAAFSVYLDFGGSDNAPGTSSDIDALGPPALRFKTDDDGTIDAVSPCIIPNAGTKYSYWKQVYLRCDTAPVSQVDNVKIYTDGGGFGTGITTNIGNETPEHTSITDSGYNVATGTPGDTGDVMTGHTVVTGVSALFTFTTGNKKNVSISEAGNIINAIGETTDYMVLQMALTDPASPGNLVDETITISYDEV